MWRRIYSLDDVHHDEGCWKGLSTYPTRCCRSLESTGKEPLIKSASGDEFAVSWAMPSAPRMDKDSVKLFQWRNEKNVWREHYDIHKTHLTVALKLHSDSGERTQHAPQLLHKFYTVISSFWLPSKIHETAEAFTVATEVCCLNASFTSNPLNGAEVSHSWNRRC